jgi:hypothetical protein
MGVPTLQQACVASICSAIRSFYYGKSFDRTKPLPPCPLPLSILPLDALQPITKRLLDEGLLNAQVFASMLAEGPYLFLVYRHKYTFRSTFFAPWVPYFLVIVRESARSTHLLPRQLLLFPRASLSGKCKVFQIQSSQCTIFPIYCNFDVRLPP